MSAAVVLRGSFASYPGGRADLLAKLQASRFRVQENLSRHVKYAIISDEFADAAAAAWIESAKARGVEIVREAEVDAFFSRVSGATLAPGDGSALPVAAAGAGSGDSAKNAGEPAAAEGRVAIIKGSPFDTIVGGLPALGASLSAAGYTVVPSLLKGASAATIFVAAGWANNKANAAWLTKAREAGATVIHEGDIKSLLPTLALVPQPPSLTAAAALATAATATVGASKSSATPTPKGPAPPPPARLKQPAAIIRGTVFPGIAGGAQELTSIITAAGYTIVPALHKATPTTVFVSDGWASLPDNDEWLHKARENGATIVRGAAIAPMFTAYMAGGRVIGAPTPLVPAPKPVASAIKAVPKPAAATAPGATTAAAASGATVTATPAAVSGSKRPREPPVASHSAPIAITITAAASTSASTGAPSTGSVAAPPPPPAKRPARETTAIVVEDSEDDTKAAVVETYAVPSIMKAVPAATTAASNSSSAPTASGPPSSTIGVSVQRIGDTNRGAPVTLNRTDTVAVAKATILATLGLPGTAATLRLLHAGREPADTMTVAAAGITSGTALMVSSRAMAAALSQTQEATQATALAASQAVAAAYASVSARASASATATASASASGATGGVGGKKKRAAKGGEGDSGGSPGSRSRGASSDEVRAKPYRPHPSSASADRIFRANSQRMFLVDRRVPATGHGCHFDVLGSTGNVYTVKIDKVVGCSCLDARKNLPCKHVIFVMLKVLRVPANDPLVWQAAFTTSELKFMMEHAPDHSRSAVLASSAVREAIAAYTGKAPQLKAAEPAAPSASSSSSSSAVEATPVDKRKPIAEDDTCAICFDDLGTNMTLLTYCLTCGNNGHKECMKQWATTKRGRGEDVTCPYCRSSWHDPTLKAPAAPAASAAGATAHGGSGASPGASRREGYVNVASLAGLDTRRDTSSYRHSYNPYANRRFRGRDMMYDEDEGDDEDDEDYM